MTLEHKTSLKSWGIFVAIAKNTLNGSKLLIFFNAKNHDDIRVRSCSMKIFCKCPTLNISKVNFWLVICIAKIFIWTTLKMIFSIFRFFFAPSDSRFSHSCISAKYCPLITNIHQWKAYLIRFQVIYKSQFLKMDPYFVFPNMLIIVFPSGFSHTTSYTHALSQFILFTQGSEITADQEETFTQLHMISGQKTLVKHIHTIHKQISCTKIISKLCFVIVQHRASTCKSCLQKLLHKINFTKRVKIWMENCVISSPSYC